MVLPNLSPLLKYKLYHWTPFPLSHGIHTRNSHAAEQAIEVVSRIRSCGTQNALWGCTLRGKHGRHVCSLNQGYNSLAKAHPQSFLADILFLYDLVLMVVAAVPEGYGVTNPVSNRDGCGA